MSPLSHYIAGVVLPHENFGSRLNSQGNTIDVELEKKDIFHASQVLADIWSHTVIDGYQVLADIWSHTVIDGYQVLADIWSHTVIDGYKVDCTALPVRKEFTPPEVSPS